MTAASPPPVRHFPVIRVFVSSTFSDLVAERNALAEKVWPELERYCRQRGFTFQAIDLRWGVPNEAGLDHRTMQICFEELHRAQEASPEPNFLILLGDKYGWRPLPETISEAEYERLREHTESPDEERTLAAWYRRDGNARPPHHVLRARTASPDGQDYTRVPEADGRLRDTDFWLAVQETLWTIVNRAYPGSLLDGRFAKGTKDIPANVRFQGSATEQEIWHGALRVENAREHVVAWFRDIDRTGGDPEPSQLRRFLDLRPDESPDPDAASVLAELKTKVEQKLAPEPFLHAQCRWERDASGAFTGEVTTDHLAPMCETILTRLRALILRQINDYWGVDLSADDATVAVVRGTQHELDLELRDHLRFAKERGPVDGFVGRDEQVRTIRDYLQASTNRPFIVHGPSGSGKTALLAYVAQQPFLPGAEAVGVSPLILTRFIGAHPESSTLRGLMTSLCRELRVHFPIPEPLPDTLQKLTEEFYAQLEHASVGQPIYVFLDALDQLEAADQARECHWLRSKIFSQTGDTPCHARILASCLSPSEEFPLDSDVCEPFRILQSRGLLVDEELGALGETAASQILCRWLEVQQRGLTDDQWQQVYAAIRASSASRQPLYLRALYEQLRDWREFDAPEPLPASLSQLIQENLTRLCQPNKHGPLPRIALGYLVSARYGLSEGEMLEIFFRDPEIQAQLRAAAEDYGHRVPPEVNRYPIAPWARLRSDLRAYLSERAAPGTTVLSCYHRQVEQAVRTLFLADEATRAERRRLLADYFDNLWDQPHAHALMELPDLLLALPDHRRLYDRLTDFAFPMRKAEVGLLGSISDDYAKLYKEGPTDLRAPLASWHDFFRENAHILRRGIADQTAHKILLQLALEHADDSPVTTAAEMWLSVGRCNWLRLQRVPRVTHLTPNPCLAVLEGHTGSVQGTLLLPCGRMILSWGHDKTLRVWDATNGACLAVLEGHTEWVYGALVLPDGRILSWGHDAMVRLWDTATGKCLAIMEGHMNLVRGALALPDGRIISWAQDATLRLWDIATGACGAVLEGHTDWVYGALALPDGRIISWSKDKTLRLWDAATGACLAVLQGHRDVVTDALALPNGQILSWAGDYESKDKTLRLWDAATGACRAVWRGHKSAVNGALILSDDWVLSWSEGDNTLRLWDAVTGACRFPRKWYDFKGLVSRLWNATKGCRTVLKGHKSSVNGALALPGGRILSWSTDHTLRVWDTATGACLTILQGHTDPVWRALLLPDGQILSWAGRTLRVWDAATGVCRAVLQGHTDVIWDALMLADRKILSWVGSWTKSYDKMRLWDAATGACLAVLGGHMGGIEGVRSLPDGRILSWSNDKTLRLWGATAGASRAATEGHTTGVGGARSLPCGRIVSWPNRRDKTLRLWDATTGLCLAVLEGHADQVWGALALPNERLLSWSWDHTLRVWDATKGACLAVLKGHTGHVTGALKLPTRRILSWSGDGMLRVWDADGGTCLAIMEGHTGVVWGAIELQDGRILSWSTDHTLRVWHVTTGACLAILGGHTGHVSGTLEMPDGRILSWSTDDTLRVWDATTGDCLAILEGHTNSVDGASTLPDGRILSHSADHTLRVWDATTGACLAVLEGHQEAVWDALALPDGRLLSWSWKDVRVWDFATEACPEVISATSFPVRHPELFHRKRNVEEPESVVGDWCADASERTAQLFHRLGFTPLPTWHAESDCEAHLLQPNGTLVITQANSTVCILKLHHGNRRVSLAEAEEILRAGGK